MPNCEVKWKYVIIPEDYGVYGTNDRKIAIEASEFEIVYDVEAGELIEPSCTTTVQEYKP